MLQCIKLEQFLPNFILMVQKAQASRDVWFLKDSTSYPTYLWLYIQEQRSSSIKKFLTQWHSPVKQNTLEQKRVSSTSKARLVHTAGTKVFYLFFHLKLGISYFFFQSLYFLCQSLFNDKTRQGWTMETQKRHKNGCYKLITVECHAVTNKCGCGINTERKAGIAQRYLNSLLFACYF